MADDVVIARFQADLDQVKKEFDEYIKALEKVQKEEKETQVETKKTGDVAQSSAQKRAAALKGTTTELNKLGGATKAAFNQKPVDQFNKEVTKTKDNVKSLSTTMGSVTSSIKGSLAGVGAGIIAAFSIQAVGQFAKASIDAFLDAEKNANKLRFAITELGGESEATFNRLIRQSERVERISIFSDDSIQQAQAALSAFGLTGNEIEKLIPKLADFASVTGVDIAQAAEQVGAGLEGAGREFKKYGIEVSATATRQENLNSILGGFTQFAGSAEEATKTLAGQLAQLDNEADNLQEKIGEGLAPIFVKLKVGIFQAGAQLLQFFGIIEDFNTSQRVDNLTTSFDNLADRLREAGKNVEEEFGKSLTKIDAQLAELTVKNNEISDQITKRVEEISRSTANISPANDAYIKRLTKEKEANQKVIDILVQKTDAIKGAIDREKALAKSAQEASKQLSDKAAAEEAARNKKLLDEQEKNLKLLRELRIKNIEDEKQRRIATYEEEIRNLTAVGELRAQIITEKEKELVNDLNEIDKKRNVDPLFRAKPSDQPAGDVVDRSADTDGSAFVDSQIANIQKVEDAEKDARDRQIAAAQNLVGELTSLYSQLAQNQIDSINSVKDAELATIDSALEANQQAVDKRRISETEAAAVEKQLLDQKLKAEQEADKKIREIKRKQAIADKAAALIQITISTAEAVANALTIPIGGVALGALYAALGAAQAAIVVAQPIPYEKGTKDAKGGLSLVGEKGPELMMTNRGDKVVNARSTSKYSKVIDAMQDDTLDDYLFRNYLTPELERQKRSFQEGKEQSFAKNISQSLMIQSMQGGKGDFYLQKLSRDLTAEAIGKAVAESLPMNDIYRR